MDLAELTATLRTFAEERDWGKFHTPKNLAVSVAIEAAELLELVQWKTDDELLQYLRSDEGHAAFADELADVLIYLVRLADVTGVDLRQAADDKVARNGIRFPPTIPR